MSTQSDQPTASNAHSQEAHKPIYTPLDSTRHEIRLLTLHPATENHEQISCTLSLAQLKTSDGSASPIYEALSYVWGKPIFSESIRLNHQEFFITPSLKYALSCLRFKSQPRVLWVDAVCINQSDVTERNQQVALMRDIYSQCQRDIAWLDPIIGKDSIFKALYNDPRLPEMEDNIKKGIEIMRIIIEKDERSFGNYFTRYTDGTYRLCSKAELVLRDLFDMPTLWQRLWVMQELSLAPRLVIMCRDAELSWDLISAFLKDEPYFDAFHVYEAGVDCKADWYLTLIGVKLIEDQRRLSAKPGQVQSKLMDVLARFHGMESTDPRDRIYSLLGLTSDDHGIKVDYTRTVQSLYQETTISLINLAGNLDILCQNPYEVVGGHKSLHQAEDAMPSWVADFDTSYKNCAEIMFAQRDIFNAGIKNCEIPCRLLDNTREPSL